MSKSSIDFYEQRIYDIEFAFTQGVFDNNEYQSRKSEALKEAKEMERKQHAKTWDKSMDNLDVRGGNIVRAWEDFDEYYNETYGGGEQ